MSESVKNCPECHNHCPVDQLQCGKGRRYFGLEPKERDHEGGAPEQGVVGLLRKCGHALHHGSAGPDFLKALTQEEQTQLEQLLTKLVSALPEGHHRH